MKILLIDDDNDITDFLESHLTVLGFATDVASTGERGISLSKVNVYDLIILDLFLPDISGEVVCGAIRRDSMSVPLLMLSIEGNAVSKTKLLNAGADDYLAKPFAFEELLARIRALLRRPDTVVPDILQIDDIKLDIHLRCAYRGPRDLKLTRTEFSLLELLMRHHGMVVPRELLLEHVWNSQVNIFSAAVDTHLSNLRRKLGRPTFIHTVPREGYRVADV